MPLALSSACLLSKNPAGTAADGPTAATAAAGAAGADGGVRVAGVGRCTPLLLAGAGVSPDGSDPAGWEVEAVGMCADDAEAVLLGCSNSRAYDCT